MSGRPGGRVGYYKGKKVFITGGSKGIGRELALKLAADGADVAISARGQQALDETVAAMNAIGSGIYLAIAFDVSDIDACTKAAETVLQGLGGLDVLICNAGAAKPGYAHDSPADDYRWMMEINYLGHVNVVRPLLQHFRSQGSGDICLVSSMIALLPIYGYSAYAGSKAAITAYAEVLRQEMKGQGVHVCVFYPSTTETPGLEAENEHKPRDVWLMEADSAFSTTFSAESAAQTILDFVPRRRFIGLQGFMTRFIYWMAQHLPGITRFMTDQEVATAQKKAAAEAAG